MKWYQVVRCDNTVKNSFVSDTEDLKDYDRWDFSTGKLIDNWRSDIWFKASTPDCDGTPDDVLQNSLGIPIYSPRLQEALTNASINGIQSLPISVLRPNNMEIRGFAIVNITNLIPCLDWELSKYNLREDRPGEVKDITKTILKRSAIENYDILRMKEFELNIIVSERFKKVFEKGKYTGYSFHERILS